MIAGVLFILFWVGFFLTIRGESGLGVMDTFGCIVVGVFFGIGGIDVPGFEGLVWVSGLVFAGALLRRFGGYADGR